MKPLNAYHRRLVERISKAGVLYMEEYPVGRRHLDIYLSEMNLAVEVDGPQHNRVKDEARDAEILEDWGIPTIRIKVGMPIEEAWEAILEYKYR